MTVPQQQAFDLDGRGDLPVPIGTKVRIIGQRGELRVIGIHHPGTETESIILMDADQQRRFRRRDQIRWPKPKRVRRAPATAAAVAQKRRRQKGDSRHGNGNG